MLVKRFVSFGSELIKLQLVFLSGPLRFNFAAHSQHGLFRNFRRFQKRFARHPIITLLVVRWNTAFIAERDPDSIPWQVFADPSPFAVNRPRRVSTRKRDSE